MSPVPTRRTGASPLSAVSTLRRALLRVLAVTVLITGIIAMHSLGLGHGPMAAGHTGPTGHTGRGVMVETTEMVGMEASAATRTMATMGTFVTDVVTEAGDPAHGMAAMCLAVLPFLVLLLARMLGFRIRGLAFTARLLAARGMVRSDRAPPGYRSPSLLKLCILRT